MFHFRTFHELLTKTPHSYSSKFQDNTVLIHDNTLRRNWGQITWTLLQVLELKKEMRDVFGSSAHWWRSLTASVVSIARRRNFKKRKVLRSAWVYSGCPPHLTTRSVNFQSVALNTALTQNSEDGHPECCKEDGHCRSGVFHAQDILEG